MQLRDFYCWPIKLGLKGKFWKTASYSATAVRWSKISSTSRQPLGLDSNCKCNTWNFGQMHAQIRKLIKVQSENISETAVHGVKRNSISTLQDRKRIQTQHLEYFCPWLSFICDMLESKDVPAKKRIYNVAHELFPYHNFELYAYVYSFWYLAAANFTMLEFPYCFTLVPLICPAVMPTGYM